MNDLHSVLCFGHDGPAPVAPPPRVRPLMVAPQAAQAARAAAAALAAQQQAARNAELARQAASAGDAAGRAAAAAYASAAARRAIPVAAQIQTAQVEAEYVPLWKDWRVWLGAGAAAGALLLLRRR